MKREPTKQQIKLWNRLVKEVFEHPKSQYSIFVYEMIKRRVLGTSKEEYRGGVTSHTKLGIDCLIFPGKKKKNVKDGCGKILNPYKNIKFPCGDIAGGKQYYCDECSQKINKKKVKK